LPASHGIFSINIARMTSADSPGWGHAIGCQIDHQAGIYRFWDVNTGFYEYPSYEQFSTQFSSYLKSQYPDYNWARAVQYTPLPPKT